MPTFMIAEEFVIDKGYARIWSVIWFKLC